MGAEDIARLDAEFADVVLTFLRENKLKARLVRAAGNDVLLISPRDPRYRRRHEAPAQLAIISKAEAKRLRKMERNRS